MCLPMLALGGAASTAGAAATTTGLFTSQLGIQMAQTMLGFAGAMATANASAQAASATAQSAANSAKQQYYAENLRLEQAGQASSREAQQLSIDRKKAVGTAMASTDGAGLSLEYLIGDFYNQEGRMQSASAKQLDWNYEQGHMNKKGIQATAEGRINAAKASVTPYPSLFSLGATMVGTGLTTYNKYYGK